jgi:predicted nucleic acid-binding protein
MDNQPVISAITEIELLCWKTATEKDLSILQSFINDMMVMELERPVKLKTADIRKTKRIKLPDAIIAATALVYDLTLLSRNISDFARIEELITINPWQK